MAATHSSIGTFSGIAPALRGGATFAVLLVAMNASLSAHAFSSPEAYVEQPYTGGGGGRWFSGSPAEGFGCSVCHSAAPGQREFPLYVAGLPVDSGYSLAAAQQIV